MVSIILITSSKALLLAGCENFTISRPFIVSTNANSKKSDLRIAGDKAPRAKTANQTLGPPAEFDQMCAFDLWHRRGHSGSPRHQKLIGGSLHCWWGLDKPTAPVRSPAFHPTGWYHQKCNGHNCHRLWRDCPPWPHQPKAPNSAYRCRWTPGYDSQQRNSHCQSFPTSDCAHRTMEVSTKKPLLLRHLDFPTSPFLPTIRLRSVC